MHPSDFEHHYLHVNGIRMHYAQAGTGQQLLLLLHGFPECWWSWRHQLALFKPGSADASESAAAGLAERFTVVAPDLRGYNETDKPSWGYELDVLVNDIRGLIHELGHREAVIAGHDWGGIIAWALAIAYPHVVTRLIVLNAPHPARFDEEIRHNWRQVLRSSYALFFQLPWLPEAVIRANDYAAIERAFRHYAVNKSRFTDQDIAIYKRAIAQPGTLTAALNYYRQMARQGWRGMLDGAGTRVLTPTVIIWAEQDHALGKELTYGTEHYVPDLRIHYLPDCSHWVQQDCPDEVNQFMLEFLQDLV